VRFKKHYTRDDARALLPHVRLWLKRMLQLRQQLQESEERVVRLMEPGRDLGGPVVNAWLRTLADLKDVLEEFKNREIQLKDLDRGLLDFPAIINGKEVFLCWEQGEEDIEFWHDLDTGYAGREKLG
jgi:hypothetical protein